jgi:hypothetical protein
MPEIEYRIFILEALGSQIRGFYVVFRACTRMHGIAISNITYITEEGKTWKAQA